MGKESDILFELINLWAEENELYSKQCTVISVNEDERTCVVLPTDGNAEIQDVQLEAEFSDGETTESKGFFVVPEVGSIVVISFLDAQYSFISAWTNISKVVAKQTEWVFNSGDNGGLTITPELKEQLDKTNTLLTSLINIISGAPIPEAGNGAASSLQAALSAAITGQELGDYSNIENENVKH